MTRGLWDRAVGLVRRAKDSGRPGPSPGPSPRPGWRWPGCPACPRPPDGCGTRLAVLLLLVCSIVFVAMTFDVSNLEGLLLWVKENKLQGSALFLVGGGRGGRAAGRAPCSGRGAHAARPASAASRAGDTAACTLS